MTSARCSGCGAALLPERHRVTVGFGAVVLAVLIAWATREIPSATNSQLRTDAVPAAVPESGLEAARASEALDDLSGDPAREPTRRRVGAETALESSRNDAVGPLPELAPLVRLEPEPGGVDILALYLAGDLGPRAAEGIVARPAVMRSHVRTGTGTLHRIESSEDRTLVDLSPFAEEDTVLEFGPGKFVLAWGPWHTGRGIGSLEICGAGMDATTLVAPTPGFFLLDKDRLGAHLSVHDLTLDAAEGGAGFDIRGRASLAFDRVRFRNWAAAGHAAAIGVTGAAFVVARDCEFVGDAGARDRALSLRGDGLVSFERCRFFGLQQAVVGPGGDERPAIVGMVDCDFLRVPLASLIGTTRGGEPRVRIVVRGGYVSIGQPRFSRAQRMRLWRAHEAASIDGVVFGRRPR